MYVRDLIIQSLFLVSIVVLYGNITWAPGTHITDSLQSNPIYTQPQIQFPPIILLSFLPSPCAPIQAPNSEGPDKVIQAPWQKMVLTLLYNADDVKSKNQISLTDMTISDTIIIMV